MPLVNMKPLLRDAMDNGYAVAAFNLVDYNTTKAMVKAAEELNAPVICQTSTKTIKYFSHKEIVSWVRTVAEDSPVPVVLHLDHCKDIAMIEACAKAGWTSIMIDASELPFEENLAQSLQVREIAEKYGVGMEAELGQIMGVEDDMHVHEDDSVLTDPQDAKRFCDALDLSAFACAVGTAHGYYKGDPVVDFDRIEAINKLTHTPMALPRRHGPVGRDLCQGDRARRGQDQHLDQPQACLGAELRRLSPRQAERLRAAARRRCAISGLQGDVPRLHREVRRQGPRHRFPQCARPGGLRETAGVVKAIIFDCDGVLVDTERDAHRVGFNLAFKELGIDAEWDVDLYGKLLLVAGGKERMRAYFDEYGWPASAATDEEKDALILDLHKTKTKITSEIVSDLPVRPGILRIIDEAMAAGVKLGVCTTSNPAFIDAVLDLFGAERKAYFSFVLAGDVVKKKKPNPEIYELAKATLGLPVHECIVIEDSRNGLLAATGAGLPTLITTSTYTVDEDFREAVKVVPELGDEPNVQIRLADLNELAAAFAASPAPATILRGV